MKGKKTQSEIDGVQYRKAKLWQIIFVACNAFIGMSIYSLIGMASYVGSIGFGITTAVVGVVLTAGRILDGVTDGLVAFIYDRVNTRFGKIRILIIAGFSIEALALLTMYWWAAGKGLGLAVFVICYVVYIIGYTIANMTALTINPIISNDPKQRPTISVWSTALNYLLPMTLSIVLNVVLLPAFGGKYNGEFLAAASRVCILVGVVGVILVCIGVSEYDKPENFQGIVKEKLSLRAMGEILRHNRPLQCYIVSNVSDKLAQQTASQAIIGTMLGGILIGNMQISTLLSVGGMLPAIVFAAVGARYAGNHGSQKTIVVWTKVSLIVTVLLWVFMIIVDTRKIAVPGLLMVIYIVFSLVKNGSMMCITTGGTSFMSDIVDFELDRSGRYVPAVVTGVYSLVDKLVTSFSAVIATFSVALVGYRTSMPQPNDPLTGPIFWVTTTIVYGLPILGWICTLVAMRFCHLDKQDMVEVQRRIAAKKEEMK